MATWNDLIAEITTLTKRPDLDGEMQLALRQAVRIAHKSGKYWRDLGETTITDSSSNAVQVFDIPSLAPQFRAVATLGSLSNERLYFNPVTIDDLLDSDGYLRQNVYWGVGTSLKLRASTPEPTYPLTYYKYPLVFPTSSFNSWIADQHSDLLILMAAAQVMGAVGEQEIRSRLEGMIPAELAELQRSNIEIVGR
jgi:hypothetical protein